MKWLIKLLFGWIKPKPDLRREPVDINKALSNTAEINGVKLGATDIVEPEKKEEGKPQGYKNILKDK